MCLGHGYPAIVVHALENTEEGNTMDEGAENVMHYHVLWALFDVS